MKRLPQVRTHTDIPQPEGDGGAGMAHAQQKTGRFEIHTITSLMGTCLAFWQKIPQLEVSAAYWRYFLFNYGLV
jgi:hypothetical protein